MLVMADAFFLHADQLDSSYLVLAGLGAVAVAVGLFFYSGMLERTLGGLSQVARRIIRQGFLVWEMLFAWAEWHWLLALAIGLLAVGRLAIGHFAVLTFLCSLV